jgi:uncharacterized protein YoxC
MLKTARSTFKQIDFTLIELRKQIDHTGEEVKKIIEQTNYISIDFRDKLESLNSIFNTVSNIGEVLEEVTDSIKTEAFSSLYKEENLSSSASLLEGQENRTKTLAKVIDFLELAGLSFTLWQKIKKRR